jgi:hypothetical protein
VKRQFPGYYRPTATEFDALWHDALLVLDANVLLSVYGYSLGTRDSLLQLLDAIHERLWVPHHFAAEYQRNRAKSILEQVAHYRNVRAQLKTILDEHFKSQHRHPFIEKRSLTAFERICAELEQGQRDHEDLLSNDPYFARLTIMLQDSIGEPYSADALTDLYKTARDRFAREMPPGYLDLKKGEPECFGDFIGWRQILDHGKSANVSVIFVTEDLKSDWWDIHSERRIGPRPELVAEYQSETAQRFYMYSLEQFIRRAQEHLGHQLGQAALQEVRERSEAQLAASKGAKATAMDSPKAEMKPAQGDAASGPEGPKPRGPEAPPNLEKSDTPRDPRS